MENIIKALEEQAKILKALIDQVKCQNKMNQQQTQINDELFRSINMITLNLKQLNTVARRN